MNKWNKSYLGGKRSFVFFPRFWLVGGVFPTPLFYLRFGRSCLDLLKAARRSWNSRKAQSAHGLFEKRKALMEFLQGAERSYVDKAQGAHVCVQSATRATIFLQSARRSCMNFMKCRKVLVDFSKSARLSWTFSKPLKALMEILHSARRSWTF